MFVRAHTCSSRSRRVTGCPSRLKPVTRRGAAVAAIGALIVLGLPTGMLGVAWPSIRDALGARLAGLGVLLGGMTVPQFAASTFSGKIRERLGTTRVLLIPAAMAAAGLALFAIGSDWIVITLAS